MITKKKNLSARERKQLLKYLGELKTAIEEDTLYSYSMKIYQNILDKDDKREKRQNVHLEFSYSRD